jgi:hypothetical protein
MCFKLKLGLSYFQVRLVLVVYLCLEFEGYSGAVTVSGDDGQGGRLVPAYKKGFTGPKVVMFFLVYRKVSAAAARSALASVKIVLEIEPY